jgi:hypothetical protein
MIRWILAKFGYYKIDYGFSCGRHFLILNGKVIAQTSGDDVWLDDESVVAVGQCLGIWEDREFCGWRSERTTARRKDGL